MSGPGEQAVYQTIGKSVIRLDAVEKVRGWAPYVADMTLPGMLYGKALRSRYPHARICSINTAKAERLPGVRAIVTREDVPFLCGPEFLKDQPLLAREKVRHMGEAVAAVAAISEEIAEEAIGLIDVEYEELPAVFDPVAATRPDAPLIHERMHEYDHHPGLVLMVPGTNILSHFKLRRGNIEEGFARSNYIFEDTFTSQMVQHCCLEPHCAITLFDLSGRVVVWTSAQSPYRIAGR